MDKHKLKCSKASAAQFLFSKIKTLENHQKILPCVCTHFLKVLSECCLFKLKSDKTDGITQLAALMVTNNDVDQVDSVPDPTAVKKQGRIWFQI